MLHTVTSNYKELAKLAGLADRPSSSERKKHLLLEMVEKGEPKPRIKSKLGQAFSNYTRKASSIYDPDFTKKIKRLAPHWFMGQQEMVRNKKRLLIDSANKNETRPRRHTELGNALHHYARKSSLAYDPVFSKKIRRLAPRWFVKTSSQNKNKILEMAENGESKPSSNSKLGELLYSYMRKSHNSYDPIFTKEIKKLAPHWFVSQSEVANEKKLELTKIAKRGGPKPNWRSDLLGRALSIYTCKTANSYDPIFTKEIKKLAPHWFKRCSTR